MKNHNRVNETNTQFEGKILPCPISQIPCSLSIGKGCILFQKAQIKSHDFDCKEEQKKIKPKIKRRVPQDTALFDKEKYKTG